MDNSELVRGLFVAGFITLFFLAGVVGFLLALAMRRLQAYGEGRSHRLPSPRQEAAKRVLQGRPASCASKMLAALLFLFYVPIFSWRIASSSTIADFLGQESEPQWRFFALFSVFAVTVFHHTIRIYLFTDRLEDPFTNMHWIYIRQLSSTWALRFEQWVRLTLLLALIMFSSVLINAGKDLLPSFFWSLLVVYFLCFVWDCTVRYSAGPDSSGKRETFFPLTA